MEDSEEKLPDDPEAMLLEERLELDVEEELLAAIYDWLAN